MLKGVVPVPAANSRSPLRQPRHRRAVKAWLREEQWKVYLSTYALHGGDAAARAITVPCTSEEETEDAVAATKRRVRGWGNAEGHGERLGQWKAAKDAYTQLLKDKHDSIQEQVEPKLDNLVVKSFKVAEETLDDRWSKERNTVALAILKGTVLSEKSKVEHGNADGVPFVIKFVDAKGGDGNTGST